MVKRSGGDAHALTGKRWVHVDGDDTEKGAVYHDESGNVPLSRRPREYLEFGDDGTVKQLITGADDRAKLVANTSWDTHAVEISFQFSTPDQRGATDYRIVEESTNRIVVSRR